MADRPVIKQAIPKTKNKAKDYNDNFDEMIRFIDESVNDMENYVDGYMPTISSNTTSKFLTNNGSVASWQGLGSGFPFSDIINGLIISKSSDDAVTVSAGSCYDSTGAIIITLGTATSKQNETQQASKTYDVYITSDGTTVDLYINLSTAELSLQTYYRLLGSYTTDADNKIWTINSLSNNQVFDITKVFPDYNKAISISLPYTVTQDGWISVVMYSNGSTTTLSVNGVVVGKAQNTGGDTRYTDQSANTFPVSVGDSVTGSNGNGAIKFMPLKGV